MIEMNDFKSEARITRQRTLEAVARVIDSGWYILGREVEAFERDWAEACGVSHAVGVGNGMDAIEIALRVLGIGEGDEVITTPMTAFASTLAIVRAGATPVLADIDPETALLSMTSVESCITPRTKAVLLVHLYGQIRDMAAWTTFCRDRGIILVEDCAQAQLAKLPEGAAGTFAPVSAFSFYPTKNLGALGDGGAIVTNDAGRARAASQFRNYGQSVRYHHPVLGMNSRLDEMQAAILRARLEWLRDWTARRQALAARYHKEMRNPLVRPLVAPSTPEAHSYHLFVVNTDRRDDLAGHLTKHGVQTLIHYPVPINRQESMRGIRCAPAGLPNSDHHAATCLSLPCHPQMSDADAQKVIDAVNSYAGSTP
jgi:dTDP-4-amino-4,6-dideoxygalactose transaminase